MAVLVLIAAHRGTRRTFRVAMTALLLTAAAGVAAIAGMTAIVLFRAPLPGGYLPNGDALFGIDFNVPFGRVLGIDPQAMSPLWFTAACLLSAALLWWARTVRATPLDYGHRIPA